MPKPSFQRRTAVLLACAAAAALLALSALVGPDLILSWRCQRALRELERCDIANDVPSPYWQALFDAGEASFPLFARLLDERDLERWSRIVRVLDAKLDRGAFARFARREAPAALASYLLHPDYERRRDDEEWRYRGDLRPSERGEEAYRYWWGCEDDESDCALPPGDVSMVRFFEEVLHGRRFPRSRGRPPESEGLDDLTVRAFNGLIAQLEPGALARREIEGAPWSALERRVVAAALGARQPGSPFDIDDHESFLAEILWQGGIAWDPWGRSPGEWERYAHRRPEALAGVHRDLADGLIADPAAWTLLIHRQDPWALAILETLSRFPEHRDEVPRLLARSPLSPAGVAPPGLAPLEAARRWLAPGHEHRVEAAVFLALARLDGASGLLAEALETESDAAMRIFLEACLAVSVEARPGAAALAAFRGLRERAPRKAAEEPEGARESGDAADEDDGERLIGPLARLLCGSGSRETIELLLDPGDSEFYGESLGRFLLDYFADFPREFLFEDLDDLSLGWPLGLRDEASGGEAVFAWLRRLWSEKGNEAIWDPARRRFVFLRETLLEFHRRVAAAPSPEGAVARCWLLVHDTDEDMPLVRRTLVELLDGLSPVDSFPREDGIGMAASEEILVVQAVAFRDEPNRSPTRGIAPGVWLAMRPAPVITIRIPESPDLVSIAALDFELRIPHQDKNSLILLSSIVDHRPEAAASGLADALFDAREWHRLLALLFLSRSGECAKAAVLPALFAMARDQHWLLRLERLRALVSLDPEGERCVAPLVEALADPSEEPPVRRFAARALGDLEPPRAAVALPALREALSDEDPILRAVAARALARIGGSGDGRAALESLLEVLAAEDPESPPGVYVLVPAFEALGELGARAAPAVRTLEKLLDAARDGEAWLCRPEAAACLLRIDPRHARARERLVAMATSGDNYAATRRRARALLDALGLREGRHGSTAAAARTPRR
jgi:hypothetical protein